ncbi:MAG: hypothetical protein NTV57_16195 [Cyanobacteria bacterium]|nr:hypothetical protein [Cyanobacteriota bacterium]
MANGTAKARMPLIFPEKEAIEVQLLHQMIHNLIGHDVINRPQEFQATQALAKTVLYLHKLAVHGAELQTHDQGITAERGSPQKGEMAAMEQIKHPHCQSDGGRQLSGRLAHGSPQTGRARKRSPLWPVGGHSENTESEVKTTGRQAMQKLNHAAKVASDPALTKSRRSGVGTARGELHLC